MEEEKQRPKHVYSIAVAPVEEDNKVLMKENLIIFTEYSVEMAALESIKYLCLT